MPANSTRFADQIKTTSLLWLHDYLDYPSVKPAYICNSTMSRLEVAETSSEDKKNDEKHGNRAELLTERPGVQITTRENVS